MSGMIFLEVPIQARIIIADDGFQLGGSDDVQSVIHLVTVMSRIPKGVAASKGIELSVKGIGLDEPGLPYRNIDIKRNTSRGCLLVFTSNILVRMYNTSADFFTEA
ncbi:hypothetical protein LCM00_16700 [Bacillus infantis]|uniref:hypothetical protein n=1 Tax=Bacillus infantis TaxID=324767 RepID=UPI001CD2571B|nr:hypothetical protein [Bacillus infantis]MCA1041157.1 hypothetical protein [Bacillus infantis]